MRVRPAVACLLSLALAACAVEPSDGDPAVNDDVDLTSLTARQRTLAFEGVVYVEPGSSNDAIVEAARKQARSAFGALLHQEVAVQTRELQNVDAKSFKKRNVTVVEPGAADGAPMIEVKYTYRDNAVVPVKMATKTALNIALLSAGAEDKTAEIVAACTKNDKEAREDAEAGLLWYNFDPSRATCKKALEAEARQIEQDTSALADPKTQVARSRVDRVYLPSTAQLASAANATDATYPEYDRLFAGPSQPGVLTISIVNGRLAHERVEARKDSGYYEWLAALDVIFTEHPDFALTKIEPHEEITYAYAENKKYDGLSFADFIQWTVYGRGWPKGMPASSRDNIAKTIADKLDNHWVTFEKKTKVQIGNKAPQDLTIRIETFFGVDDDTAPHRRALKHGDVVVYNGHSYIGEGPLDPANYTKDSFSKGYQMFWFDSCVSYNYYEKDFFLLKEGGSKNLDLITNGLEAPEWMSGEAEGKFIAKLIGGTNPSYGALLQLAKATDALRVVDGEIDNKWSAAKTPIKFVR
ncbi:MAG: hypothetical protein KIT84_07735 [Labilithrix sp.]|nr:hypothetical protein [Labilithrix sp.]MCW5810887.1 hypothetical protein [Labilithrix sp.]